MLRLLRLLVACCALASPLFCTQSARAEALSVTRATLANGLQVVVVHDPLAPVVTTMMNYKVGSDEQFAPGLAHATEHMMFRGSKTLSSAAFMDVMSAAGGDFDADTQNAVTQYFFTVPAQYLDAALRLERSRATGALMAQSQWGQERKAITQEVTQDNSDALYRLSFRMSQHMLAGTPYANNTLGTVQGFRTQVNSPQLRRFYDTWYHPNNAVYVIVGNVDGPSTIARVRQIFGDVPRGSLPARPAVRLRPITAATYRETSALPFTVVLLGYRLPGYASPDYAAGQILGDVLSSQRGDLYQLVADGKMLYTAFTGQSFRETSIGIEIGIVPESANPAKTAAMLDGVIARYRENGLPASLVEAAKRAEIAQLEYNRNSIESLAFDWSNALAVQGLQSPDDMIAAFDRVTVADVNRVLRADLVDSRTVTAFAVPKNNGHVSMGATSLVPENNEIEPSHHVPLPAWAHGMLAHVRVPQQTLSPYETTLPNGIRLIVQSELSSKSVTLSGEIRNDPQVQEPAQKEGVAGVTEALLPYGTTTYGRVAYQAQLDAIAANVSAGTSFSLQVLSPYFARGVQLLADDELHPAFAASDFQTVKTQSLGELAGEMQAPDHLAQLTLANALYPKGDAKQRFASPRSVSGLTLDDVHAWYASAYRPDLTTIVVVGDVTPAQARSVVQRYFGSWHATGPKPVTEPPPVPANVASSAVVPATGRVQSSVTLAQTTAVQRTSPDWAALQVANAALTGGFYGSLLYHDLRQVHGYAYDVSSEFAIEPTRGLFAISYGCDPKNILPAQGLIVGDLLRLQRAPLSADRLQRAKALLMGVVPIREANYDGIAAQLLDFATHDLPLNQDLLDARAELQVSGAGVQHAMERWIRPRDFVRVVTGPGPT